MTEGTVLPPAVVALVVDQWRLLRSFSRVIDQIPEASRARVSGQARFHQSRLDSVLTELGLVLATYEGRVFDGSLPPTAQNSDDFAQDRLLIVQETIEPTLIFSGRILHSGKVNLADQGDA